MSINIKGGASTNLFDVQVDGNSKATMPLDIDAVGYVNVLNTGLNTATTKQVVASQDYRTNYGIDRLLWNDVFCGNNLNSSKYLFFTSAETIACSFSGLTLNSNLSTVVGSSSQVRTAKTFVLSVTYPTYVDFTLKFSTNEGMDPSTAIQNGNVCEFGLGFAVSGLTPTDGIFFRSNGEYLDTVTNYNSNEQTSQDVFSPPLDTFSNYRIVISEDEVEFWVDNQLKTVMPPIAVSTGGTTMSTSLPIFLRNYNSGTPNSGVKMVISSVSVTLGDTKTNKNYGTYSSLRGLSSISDPGIRPAGQTAESANSSTASTIALSNSVAGYTALGGQFQFMATTSGETDYAVFAYYNPESSANTFSKILMITDIRIDTYNTGAANAGSPTLLMWSVAVGSTHESLATSDSVTLGTRGPRCLTLGTQTLSTTAAVGAIADKSIDVNFKTPLLVEPGSYFHLLVKIPVCIATANQMIRGIASINGYFQ